MPGQEGARPEGEKGQSSGAQSQGQALGASPASPSQPCPNVGTKCNPDGVPRSRRIGTTFCADGQVGPGGNSGARSTPPSSRLRHGDPPWRFHSRAACRSVHVCPREKGVPWRFASLLGTQLSPSEAGFVVLKHHLPATPPTRRRGICDRREQLNVLSRKPPEPREGPGMCTQVGHRTAVFWRRGSFNRDFN